MSTTALAAAPSLIPVTGYLTASDGTPTDGAVDLTLSLYPNTTSTSAVWSDTITADVDQGQFTVYLGESTALDLALFRDEPTLFLGVSVEGATEMTPRLEVGTSPYAAYAQYCDTAATLDGIDPADIRLTTDVIDFADIDATTLPAGLTDGDSDTTYTAGAGLSLTGTRFDVSQTQVETWAMGVGYDTLAELTTALGGTYIANQTCASGFVLAANGTGGWTCTDPNTGLNALTSRVTTAEGSITTLQSTVATHTTNLSTLQTGLATANTNIASLQSPRRNCKDILTAAPTSPDGVYTIQPDASAPPLQAFCDMTRDGGGWTLLITLAPATVTNGANFAYAWKWPTNFDVTATAVAPTRTGMYQGSLSSFTEIKEEIGSGCSTVYARNVSAEGMETIRKSYGWQSRMVDTGTFGSLPNCRTTYAAASDNIAGCSAITGANTTTVLGFQADPTGTSHTWFARGNCCSASGGSGQCGSDVNGTRWARTWFR